MSKQGGSEEQFAPYSMADLGSALPTGSAALSAEDRAGLVNALKDKLQHLAGQQAGFLDSLSPSVKSRVSALQEIQSKHDELEAKFFEERAALEAKYQKLYEPLYAKRYEIVNGISDVESKDESENNASTDENKEEEKGVPEFWLTAMKTNEVLSVQITGRDEGALKYLKDIKWCRFGTPKYFKIDFYFDPNPFFKNSVLTKTYRMFESFGFSGTEIDWYPGKNLTQKLMKKKPKKLMKKKPKKGAKNAKPVTKTEQCESFFNFFSPPPVPDNCKEVDKLDNKAVKNLADLMKQDYDIGLTIRDKIIPHAVSWFTGEACQLDELEDVDEEDEEDGDEDEDEDEEEDVKPRKSRQPAPKSRQPAPNVIYLGISYPFFRGLGLGSVKRRSGPAGEQPPECKQQYSTNSTEDVLY
eukprot:PITA_03025